ncbi:TNF receptor-associated factor 2-like isoform X4 [Varroa destructor]|uniref:TRAF-type domain-containing protein n=1 Tax=Varroa destructor TaxID=109461 RepID=A0A7M7KIT9_VARDE|nr:TNF receptor-associated factor 2-like isoform X4 [Varroa destructor]
MSPFTMREKSSFVGPIWKIAMRINTIDRINSSKQNCGRIKPNFILQHSSFRKNKVTGTSSTSSAQDEPKPRSSSKILPRSPTEVVLSQPLIEVSPRPSYNTPALAGPMATRASVTSGRHSNSTSNSSSPAPPRRLTSTPARSNADFVKVVLRDFPGWAHDHLVSLRGVPAGARCSSCACVAGTLFKAPCTCAFCTVCLRKIGMESVVRCRTHGSDTLRSEFVEDPYVYTLCMDLNAMCIWNADGCNFEGSLINVHEHSEGCLFREETCPDCDKCVSFRALASHRAATCTQRKVACQMCGQHLFASTLERHISVCPDVEVLCQLCGRRDIKRGQSEVHRIECTSMKRACRLHVFGCTLKATSKELRDHESTDIHLDMIVSHAGRQEQRLRRLEENQQTIIRGAYQNVTDTVDSTALSSNELLKSIEVLRSQVLQLSNQLKMISNALLEDPFFWNLCPYKGILEIASDGAQVLYSDSFYTPTIPGYKMRLRLLVDHRARLLHLTPQLLPGAFNNVMPWPFPSQYLLRLVDQSGQGLHKDLPVTTGATGNIEKPLESGRVLRSPNLQVKFDELECEGGIQSGSGTSNGALYSQNDCIVFMFKMNLPADFIERM